MQSPQIGETRTIEYRFSFPCQDDTEEWTFLFIVEVHRISRAIFDYYWKERSLGKGMGRQSQQTRWYAIKMIIERELHKIAFDHALCWSDMDYEVDGGLVIPVQKLSTGQAVS